jgi:hypothetical protein
MMFVNISPTLASINETICSLRFANQVSQVELGKAQKNIFTTASVIPQLTATVANNNENTSNNIPPAAATSRKEEKHSYGTAPVSAGAPHAMNITSNKPFSAPSSSSSTANSRRESMAHSRKVEFTEQQQHQQETVPEGQAQPQNNKKQKVNVSSRNVRFDTFDNSENIVNQQQPTSEEPHELKSSSSGSNILSNTMTSFLSSTPTFTRPSTTTLNLSNYSFLPQGNNNNGNNNANQQTSFLHTATPTPGTLSMNEKLHHYLMLKQRNLGTSQRRSSVLPAAGNNAGNTSLIHNNSALWNPARNSLLPSNNGSGVPLLAVNPTEQFMGKRDHSTMNNHNNERSFLNENSMIMTKKSRTDGNNNNYYALNTSTAQSNRKNSSGWRLK